MDYRSLPASYNLLIPPILFKNYLFPLHKNFLKMIFSPIVTPLLDTTKFTTKTVITLEVIVLYVIEIAVKHYNVPKDNAIAIIR